MDQLTTALRKVEGHDLASAVNLAFATGVRRVSSWPLSTLAAVPLRSSAHSRRPRPACASNRPRRSMAGERYRCRQARFPCCASTGASCSGKARDRPVSPEQRYACFCKSRRDTAMALNADDGVEMGLQGARPAPGLVSCPPPYPRLGADRRRRRRRRRDDLSPHGARQPHNHLEGLRASVHKHRRGRGRGDRSGDEDGRRTVIGRVRCQYWVYPSTITMLTAWFSRTDGWPSG